ncbi:MAG: PHP domain-containing protein [Candidatus Marinimicrobia bacterium]|nr:PHP domain-containing protein [Candidatus Neomarinimicrobiota bacterium]
MKHRHILSMLILVLFASLLTAQIIPDLPKYKTLKCDFHMHTIFSDGLVWPTIRVDEAVDEGLDAIAITDHLEYLPHKKHVSTDKNISFEIAKRKADRKGLICIAGAEITRWMPPGHLNAIFLKDANKLVIDDFLSVIEEAIDQGAFIFWNHPGWIVHQPDRVVRWYDIHTTLVERGWMHGIEFANTHEYYPAVLEFTNKHELAHFGNSDVHGIVYHDFLKKNAHRPLTLVFAEERSEEAIKEALFARRTIALSEDDVLAGPEELLYQFVEACINIENVDGEIKVSNLSEIPFIFERSDLGEFTLGALGEVKLPGAGEWVIMNTFVDKNNHLILKLSQ